MADDTQALDIEVPEDELEPVADETVEPIEGEEGEAEFSIEIEGEEAADEPPLVKTLRQEIRDRDRELSEHRKAAMPKIEVGEEPTLENCEYDEDRFKEDWRAWEARRVKASSQEADAQKAAEARNQQVQRRFTEYRTAAATLPVKDFDAAEAAVISVLPDTPDRPFQQALLNYTKDPAKLVYALGKYPAKLEALAQETDPIRFILALNDMERNLKVTNRRKPPEPEAGTIIRGSAPASTADKRADKLLAEAARSGNMDAYREHMRSKRKPA